MKLKSRKKLKINFENVPQAEDGEEGEEGEEEEGEEGEDVHSFYFFRIDALFERVCRNFIVLGRVLMRFFFVEILF